VQPEQAMVQEVPMVLEVSSVLAAVVVVICGDDCAVCGVEVDL